MTSIETIMALEELFKKEPYCYESGEIILEVSNGRVQIKDISSEVALRDDIIQDLTDIIEAKELEIEELRS